MMEFSDYGSILYSFIHFLKHPAMEDERWNFLIITPYFLFFTFSKALRYEGWIRKDGYKCTSMINMSKLSRKLMLPKNDNSNG